MIPNREKLKVFIRSYAIRLGNRSDSPWIFYDDTIKDKYQIEDRLSTVVIERFRKSMTITLDVSNSTLKQRKSIDDVVSFQEILREQERIVRKQERIRTIPSGSLFVFNIVIKSTRSYVISTMYHCRCR
jgi:hypothetical protein